MEHGMPCPPASNDFGLVNLGCLLIKPPCFIIHILLVGGRGVLILKIELGPIPCVGGSPYDSGGGFGGFGELRMVRHLLGQRVGEFAWDP